MTSGPIVRAGVGPAVFIPLAVRGTILGTLTVANAKGAAAPRGRHPPGGDLC